MDYMAEPTRNERVRIGIVVMMYLAVLFVLVYSLKRMYWKDVTRRTVKSGASRIERGAQISENARRRCEAREGDTAMMTLYSGTTDPFSQRCRIVLHEKGMDFQIIDVDLDHKPEDLAVMNPYNQVPVLVERDLVLHESNIINEYIDERFPHPQLMPADPVMRARARLFLHRFEKELFIHIDALEGNNQKSAEKARSLVRDALLQITPVFAKHKHMLGEDYSMLDVAITPLLWRLDYYGIAMPKQAAPLMKYAERLFARPAFSEALTSAERGMRK
jgi:RNA polymerase-associated protein